MKRLLLSLLILLAIALLTMTAHSFPVNQCPADRYGSDLDLGCTAGDVSITGMAVVGDTTSCIGGTPVTLDLEMTVNFANPDRWDIGIFISNDGKDPQIRAAFGGAATCSVSVLPNSSPFQDLDGPTDTCGDGGGSLSGIHYMSNVTVPCQSLAEAGGQLFIPFVVTWDNQETKSNGSGGAICTSNADPVSSTTSKCNSPTIVQGKVAVVVMPTITNTDSITTLFSSDTTSYTVTITNTTGATLSGAVFKDPAVTGIAANSVICSAAGGASCPVSTVTTMQGAGITIPDMPAGSSVTFTIGATLTGSPGDTRTNTATVTVGGKINSASDTNIIVDTIAILPTPQSKTGAKGGTVTYTYTLSNFGSTSDTITLAAVSSNGWTVSLSPTSPSLNAGTSTTVTLTVTIPSGASIGDVDTTTITATSGVTPAKKSIATGVTTVTTVLTLTPSNTGSGGAGSSTYYTHRVQSNDSTSKNVSLTTVLTGTCTGWSSALFATDKTTPLASPVTLAANGGFRDFVLRMSIPPGATTASTCTATLTAQYTSGTANAVSVTDVTTVKNLLLYKDPGYTTESYVYPAGNNVYAKGFGLNTTKNYEYRWYDSNSVEICTPRASSTAGTIFPDTCQIPVAGPLGTWTAQIWNTTNNVLFSQTNFYVGPDHLKASYTGANPAINTNAVVNLELHDKFNHVVPKDPAGNLVKGSLTDPEGPLMITVTVSGSAQIVSTTLTNYTILGKTVTGKLDSTTGTATLTISDSIAETVTITPVSYKGVLHGSPLRNEPATVTFIPGVSGPNHYELSMATSSITCMATNVNVKACADSSSPCTSTYAAASGKTATLTATGATPVTTTVTFDATGVASSTISYPAAINGASASVTLSGESTTASNPRQCCPDGINCVVANSCSTTFNSAGFIFSSSAGGAVATIPSQTAGTASSTYYLRAVKTSTITKACEAALTGANAVNFAYECNDPTTCYAANLMSVNGGSATTIARNNNGSVVSFLPVTMTFDANGNAPFTFNYGDVGQVTLHTNKTTANSAVLTGSSNPFMVKPDHFDLSGIQQTASPFLVNPAAADASGNKFVKAGEQFSVTVTAKNSLGVTTPSFGLGSNNGTETVVLTHTRVAPTGGATVDGTLSGTTSILRSSFSNGIATTSDLSWNEVGIITLTATNSAFLANALTTSGTTGNIGRFIPDHFTITTGSITEGCSSIFTYFGQDGFSTAFTLTAQNPAPATTLNYTGSFAKLDLSDWSKYNFTATWVPAAPSPASTLSASATAPTGSWINGVASVNVKHQASRPTAPVAPADITVSATPTDTDGVTTASAVAVHAAATPLRYGRLVLQNAYGPETEPIIIPALFEYYDGSEFLINSDDSSTDPGSIATYQLDNTLESAQTDGTIKFSLTASTTLTISPTNALAGLINLEFSPPGSGETGYTDIEALINSSLPWLQYDWDEDGNYDNNPTATATFGIYRGNDRIINWQEIVR